MTSQLEVCKLNGNNKKITIYLIESESREKYSDFQVRIYGDGETNKDIRFKYKNFSTRNTESAFQQANEYFQSKKEDYLSQGMIEKVGLIDRIKQKFKV